MEMESEDLLNDDPDQEEVIDDDLTGVDVDGLLGDDDQSMPQETVEHDGDQAEVEGAVYDGAVGEEYYEEGTEDQYDEEPQEGEDYEENHGDAGEGEENVMENTEETGAVESGQSGEEATMEAEESEPNTSEPSSVRIL